MGDRLKPMKAIVLAAGFVSLLIVTGCGRERPSVAADKTAAAALEATSVAIAKLISPTAVPPTLIPTALPTETSTAVAPTEVPTEAPTEKPIEVPTETPTEVVSTATNVPSPTEEALPTETATPVPASPTPTIEEPTATNTPEPIQNTPIPETSAATPTPVEPTATSVPMATNTVVPTPMAPPEYHLIRQGQTMEQIAAMYGTTTPALLNMNGMVSPGYAVPGQRLRVPAMPVPQNPEGIIHVMKSGETLYALSRRYNIPVSTIAAANGLTGKAIEDLWTGQRVIIPGVR